ncbi:NUDIX domain-containing protein [Candidatus Gracilibacteria bacterium]|nr:NUDIX domain-containing protein [Candidatus Gracilibacteria bacterium]
MKNIYEGVKQCHYRISAKAILRNSEGKFALCLKEMLVDGVLQSRLDIPGGGIDHGETAIETIKREIFEEMGLIVRHIDPSPKYFFTGESTCTRIPMGIVCYETEVENFDYTPSEECRVMNFYSLEEALNADLYPAVRTSLEEAQKLFGKF